jgi:hypothetical protein
MQLVSTVTLGSAAASIEFTSIPQTGTDLLVTLSARSGNTLRTLIVNFNSSGSGYSARALLGTGSSPTSFTTTDGSVGQINSTSQTASTFGNMSIYIPNYTSSVAKSVSTDSVWENNGTEAYQMLYASTWSGTAAITSVKLIPPSTFGEFSTASLYTITKA